MLELIDNREKRKQIANETLEIIRKGAYINENGKNICIEEALKYAISNSVLYKPEEFEEILKKIKDEIQNIINLNSENKVIIEVTNESTIATAVRLVLNEQLTHTVCLNFASACNPGGGFQSGSQAQEESLVRSSGLYPCIAQMQEMYDYNRNLKTCLYSDHMTFSPDVPFFRNDNGILLKQPFNVSVISAPAVNAGIVMEREKDNASQIHSIMTERIRKILSIAAINKYRGIILGAFGCGVFKNKPEYVAGYFKKLLKDEGYEKLFEKIVFAIYDNSTDGRNFKAFNNAFGR